MALQARLPGGGLTIRTPARLAALGGSSAEGFARLADCVAETWRTGAVHIFIGAAAIAVRAIAPLLTHKSTDPPVLALDPGGKFCISLLSGHLGGGNVLCRMIADLIGASPVITTASDCQDAPALDLFLKEQGGVILDWDKLPVLQGRLLEGDHLRVWDPHSVLPATGWLCSLHSPDQPLSGFDLAISWHALPRQPGVMRVAASHVCAGLGFRKDVTLPELSRGFEQALGLAGLVPEAICLLATVEEKAPLLRDLGQQLGLEAAAFSSRDLASISSPGASMACGRRFGLPSFSVCESAALLGAQGLTENPDAPAALIQPKIILNHRMTFAFAAPMQER